MDINEKLPRTAANLGAADRIGADDLAAALTRGVLRAIDERGPAKFDRRIWAGIWIDYGPNGPLGGPLGEQIGPGGIRG